ncbi:type II secretion system minor pseudopilin GspJ [Hyphomonas johnsonii]|uniref:Type II secretion system protein J n=1 Tax=Hyphomonas johnsonii MHS-2 TaxID=1280950 RepID=A0A059FUL6_9PROT|nr:type II secretion system minor pseudopilin GspJ [Hyphomonas johnsonii]KCZ94302.1 general secretion pathway protein J [Hyphomonas johnsonii MHS-2]
MSARESGFTLIETLVALGVTATLATSGTVMMLQTLQASRAVDTRMDEVRTLEAANGLFRADLGEVTRRASAPPDDLSPPVGFLGKTGEDAGDIISFVRTGWRDSRKDSDRSDLQRVAYRFEDGNLIRTAWLRPNPAPATPVVERVLLSGIDSLTVHYRSAGRWYDEWPATPEGDHPDLVEFEIRFAEQDVLRLAYMVGAIQ